MSNVIDHAVSKLARIAFKVGYQVAKDDLEAGCYDVELATGHSTWIRRIRDAINECKERVYANSD